jgi:hypothetical protein
MKLKHSRSRPVFSTCGDLGRDNLTAAFFRKQSCYSIPNLFTRGSFHGL